MPYMINFIYSINPRVYTYFLCLEQLYLNFFISIVIFNLCASVLKVWSGLWYLFRPICPSKAEAIDLAAG